MAQGETRRTQTEYDQSDVEVVLKRGNWHSWNDAIQWLRGPGMNDNELTPREVQHIAEDFSCLANDGQTYTNDPGQAYEMAKSACRHH